MNEQTAIYLNQDEISAMRWALHILRLTIDMDNIKITQEKVDTIARALSKLKEGENDLTAKMEAKRQAKLCERAAKACAASFAG